MGVTGGVLARILRTAGRQVDLSKYRNGIDDRSTDAKRRKLRPLRIGLDGSGWIARAAHGNGRMLVDDRFLTDYGRAQISRGEETELDLMTSVENRRDYVKTCTERVLSQILELQTVTKAHVTVVLDGKSPPIKEQETKRRRQRKANAKEARDAPDADKALSQRFRAAREAGADGSYGDIIEELIHLFRENNISFLVAPYEADGQLGYLAERGLVDLVITEDSDLLCQSIHSLMFKYANGSGMLVLRQDLGAMEIQDKSLSLPDFNTTMIAIMFVSIGCDYCESLPGIGPITARNIVSEVFARRKKVRGPLLRQIFDKLYSVCRYSLTQEEMDMYEECFLAALFAFQHQVIFCPLRGKCFVANDPPHGSDPLLLEYEPYEALCNDVAKQQELIGALPERRLQRPIAEGWISARTMMPFPNMILPEHLQATLRQPKCGLTAPETQNSSIAYDVEQEMLAVSAETEQDLDDDNPGTQAGFQCEGPAAHNEESTSYDTQHHETQHFETQVSQAKLTTAPDSGDTEGLGTQKFHQSKSPTDSSNTRESNFGRSLQPKRSIDIPLSPHQIGNDVVEIPSCRVGVLPPKLLQSKSPLLSSQSSRNTSSTSSKYASQATFASDASSPPLLP